MQKQEVEDVEVDMTAGCLPPMDLVHWKKMKEINQYVNSKQVHSDSCEGCLNLVGQES